MADNGVQFTADELPKIPDSWQWGRLGDLVDQSRGICYGIVQPGKHDESGVPMVNSQDVLDGTVASRVEFRVAKELHARFKRSTIRGGEVLLTLVGANFGRVAIAPSSFAGFNCSRAVGIIPVLQHPQFVMFCLRSPLTRRFLDNWANTTAQPTFNLKEVANLPIPLPPLAEQKAIAHILGTLDDKIELNRRMNATLEEMARALFQSWFVDFDPVHENIRRRQSGTQQHPANPFEPTAQAVGLNHHLGGNPPTGVGGSKTGGSHTGGPQFAKTNDGPYPNDEPTAQAVGLDSTSRSGGGFGMNPPTGVGGSTFGFSVPPDIAALFPDSFEDSELGRIPKGWGVGAVCNYADLNPESWTKSTYPDEVRYVDLSSTKWGEVGAVERHGRESAPSRAQRILRVGDTIFGTVRPGNGSFAFVEEDGLTGSTGFAVIRPKCREWREYVYVATTEAENVDRLAHLADGGAYPAVRPEVIADTPIVDAPLEIVKRYSDCTSECFSRINNNRSESRTLAALRDTLLPKLLSGELRVPDAEKIVERTV